VRFKLELVAVPVSDVDRAKTFYADQAGFNVDLDFSHGETFRGDASRVSLLHRHRHRRRGGRHGAELDPGACIWSSMTSIPRARS
jgi:catechol 2,3-dioxygenase-like lactoylglutathione lyase family enzyme